MSARRYIGGPFELSSEPWARTPEDTLQAHFNLDETPHTFTASGRSALALALDRLNLSGGKVLVPDFLCTEAVYPILERLDLQPVTFEVGPELEQSAEVVLEAASRTSALRAVILTAYFGLVEPAAAGKALAEARPDLPVILDTVQDLAGLGRAKSRAAWAPWQAFSLHKFLPVPHGGLLVGPNLSDRRDEDCEAPVHSALAFAAAELRGHILRGEIAESSIAGWERAFVDLSAQAEAVLPIAPAPFPRLSRLLLRHIDVAAAFQRRRINLAFLTERLSAVGGIRLVAPSPSADAAPLALPVLIDGDRDRLRMLLRQRGMFCPVHWPLPDRVLGTAGPFARHLAKQILSLPLDQRYTPEDLEELAAAIETFSD